MKWNVKSKANTVEDKTLIDQSEFLDLRSLVLLLKYPSNKKLILKFYYGILYDY
jgi:hypothetical protein